MVEVMTIEEVENVNGGIAPLGWMIIGYVVGEIVNGLYDGAKEEFTNGK